jgi:hypothetical protein
MARLGMKHARAPLAPRRSPDRTVNKAGGEAFTISDPSLRMLTLLGSSFWNEPTYHGSGPDEDPAGLSEEARAVLQTAEEIARSQNPRDLLVLARWARTDMNLRTTPQVLLAVAAKEPATKPFVRAYTPLVVQRADELRQVFAAYLTLFAGGVGANVRGQKLPNALKRGLADTFGRFTEAQLMKYDSDVRPTFRDVLRMIDRGTDRGLPKAVYTYLVTGEVTDPDATPVIAARKRLARLPTLDDEARALIKVSHASWESVLSQFGNGAEVWRAVLPELGYMALLRNLRNLCKAGVDLTAALERLGDPAQVARSRQLPFRFYSAFLTLRKDRLLAPPVAQALERAIAHAADNLPKMPGVTVVASDNSGSMSATVSAKSVMTRQGVANVLAAIAHRRSDNGTVVVFGDKAAVVQMTPDNGVLQAADRQAATNVGHSTNAHAVLKLMLRMGLRADRLILFSDMQCWNSSGGADTFSGCVAEYRRKVNPGLWVHSVDLAGHGTAVLSSGDPRVNLLSGYSEKILASVLDFEGARAAENALPTAAQVRSLPTLDELRARF